jgi:hypothetical protein
MKRQYLTFILGAALLLTNSKTSAQTVIKFNDQSCKENCDVIKNLSTATTNKDIFLNFSIGGIQKIALKPSEVLMVEFNFYDESSSFEEICILAKQDDKNLIVGESILLPNSNSSSIEVNTIYGNEPSQETPGNQDFYRCRCCRPFGRNRSCGSVCCAHADHWWHSRLF